MTHEEVALESIKILALESRESLEVNGDFRQAALMKILISIKTFIYIINETVNVIKT